MIDGGVRPRRTSPGSAMPPRPFVAVIVVGWVAALGWLAVDRWLPWLRTDDRPPFAVDLADEVAPQHASWVIHRRGAKVGSAETRMAPRKDGQFDLSGRLRELDVTMGLARIQMPLFLTTRTVNRDGDLVALTARTQMTFRGLGSDLKVEATVTARVEGDQLVGDYDFDTGGGRTAHPLDPIPLPAKAAFAPLEPLQKYPALRPGQSWRVSNVDPVAAAMNAVARQVIKKEFGLVLPRIDQPAELLARVQDDLDPVGVKGKEVACRVILFTAKGVTARTWVDPADGKVLRQEATLMGETMTLVRE